MRGHSAGIYVSGGGGGRGVCRRNRNRVDSIQLSIFSKRPGGWAISVVGVAVFVAKMAAIANPFFVAKVAKSPIDRARHVVPLQVVDDEIIP